MKINASVAKRLSDMSNGKIPFSDFPNPEIQKEIRTLMVKIMYLTTLGHYECLFAPSDPYPDEMVQGFKDLGFDVELRGFKYYFNWRNA